MNKLLLVGMFLLGVFLAIALTTYSQSRRAVNSPSVTRRAFEEREKLDWPTIAPYVAMMGGEQFVRAERWKNFLKYQPFYIHAEDAVKIVVSRTSDTHDWVITILNPDGKESEFWVDGGEENKELPIHDVEPCRSACPELYKIK